MPFVYKVKDPNFYFKANFLKFTKQFWNLRQWLHKQLGVAVVGGVVKRAEPCFLDQS